MGGSNGEQGRVSRPFQSANRDQKTLAEDLQGSGGHSRALAEVLRCSRRARWGQKALPEGREGSGGPSGGLGGFGKPSQWSWRVWDDHPEGQEWLGCQPERQGGVGWGRESLLDGREESGGPPEGPTGVRKPLQRTYRGLEALPELRQGSVSAPRGHIPCSGGTSRAEAVCPVQLTVTLK